eukprot:467908_1
MCWFPTDCCDVFCITSAVLLMFCSVFVQTYMHPWSGYFSPQLTLYSLLVIIGVFTLKKIMAIQKHDGYDAAAVLVASSVPSSGSDIKGVSSRKFFGVSRSNNNLSGTCIDVCNVLQYFNKSGAIKTIKAFNDPDPTTTTKINVLKAIKKLFNQYHRKVFVIYYSGHGYSDGGKWCFHGDQFISLNDILSLFDTRIKSNIHTQQLIIIADSCYSGKWVQILKQLKRNDIAMQAACKPTESSADSIKGGVFTIAFLKNSLNYKKKMSSIVSVPLGIFSVAAYMPFGVAAMIKNAVIGLPGEGIQRAFCFTPCYYGEPYGIDTKDKKYRFWFDFSKSWVGMNLDGDVGTILKYTSFGTVGVL